MAYRTLYSVTRDPLTGGGIFTALQSLNPPWVAENIALKLDLIYYGNISGSKITSPLVDRLLSSGKLSAESTGTLASALMATNGERWAREWATMVSEYDPIENYNMEEEMSDDETVTEYGHTRTRTDNLAHSETRTDNLAHSETRTDNLAHSETRTDNLAHSETRTDNLAHSETRTDNLAHSETRTDNLTHTVDEDETATPGITTTRQDSVRGFNSSSDVNTDKSVESASGSSTRARDVTEHDTGTVGTTGSNTGTQATQGSNTGTQQIAGTDTGTQSTQGSNTGTQQVAGTDTGTQATQGTNTGTQTDAETGSDTQTRNYKLTRKGNIGVTTTQQMLESERQLWQWSYFYDVVFPDIDELLTMPLYADPDEDAEDGSIIPTGTIRITANGTGIDVYRYAAADVAVPNTYTAADEGKVVSDGALISQGSLEITENGTYDTTIKSSVNVEVPNSYTAADEGKVVSDGALISQGSLEITENGTYDTTIKSSVTVNIQGYIGTALMTQGQVSDTSHYMTADFPEGSNINSYAFLTVDLYKESEKIGNAWVLITGATSYEFSITYSGVTYRLRINVTGNTISCYQYTGSYVNLYVNVNGFAFNS